MTRVALTAAEQLASSGISCEVIDLRTLAPLDIDTLCDSVRQTGFLLTLEEGQVVCGVGAELAFRVRDRCPETRVARVGARPIPVASSPALESFAIPDSARVVDAVHLLLGDAVARKAL
jgi:pyruvate dehydrogenase E1 component beta subunit